MTDEEIKKIGDEMMRVLQPFAQDLEEVKGDVKTIKKEVGEMSENVDAARGDIFTLQDDVKGIKEELSIFKDKQNHYDEEIGKIKKHINLPVSETA